MPFTIEPLSTETALTKAQVSRESRTRFGVFREFWIFDPDADIGGTTANQNPLKKVYFSDVNAVDVFKQDNSVGRVTVIDKNYDICEVLIKGSATAASVIGTATVAGSTPVALT